jgi:hypothetical protein
MHLKAGINKSFYVEIKVLGDALIHKMNAR